MAPGRPSAWKLVCAPSKATTSPSTAKRVLGSASSAAATAGKRPLSERSLRESSLTAPPSRIATQRMPSSLRWSIQSGSLKRSCVRTARIADAVAGAALAACVP